MKITIKNLKVAEFASIDSTCFECSVYIDGKRSFTAHNQGYGGCNDYHAVKGMDYSVIRDTEAYVKTLPALKFDDDELAMDLDLYISTLMTEYEQLRQAKKIMKDRMCFANKGADGATYYGNSIKKFGYYQLKAHALKANPDAIILNDLPLDQAKAYF